jgi:hypothetical protein
MESDSTSTTQDQRAQDSLSEKSASSAPSSGALASTGVGSSPAAGRVEVSAQTITRMMGIASTTDLKLLEGRLDLLTSKVSSMVLKLDRVLTMLGSVPTPSDIGRIEIQLGSLKSMLREALESVNANRGSAPTESPKVADEQSRKLAEGIRSSSES